MVVGRKRIAIVLATLCLTAVGGSVLGATPTFAKPSIADVASRVQRLYHQAEIASERYNNARMEVEHARTRLSTLRADLKRQQDKVGTIRDQVAASVVAQSQGQALAPATHVMLSRNPDAFLNQLVMVSQYNDQQTQMMRTFATQSRQLDMRKSAAQRELARITQTKQQLAADKAQIDKKASEAKDLLSHLKAKAAARAAARAAAQAAAQARRQAASRSSSPSPAPSSPTPSTSTAPVSSGAAAAVAFAKAQLGDSYVYGASGPDAWDCSGLTMMAWKQAGVSLPHSSSAQMSYGTPVSSSNLQPGDLVFYYQPVSHVGIYIGNGKIVNAENPSVGVVVAPVFMMPFSGAVRPG